MNTRRYKFSWDCIGNIQLGRPNLGNSTRIEIYRLFQYTMRDILEESLGAAQTDELFHKAGFLAGKEFYNKYLAPCPSLSSFMDKAQHSLREMGVGILRVEQADANNMEFVLTIVEDLDCSGLPETGYGVCTYDEGFLAGLFEAYSGQAFSVKEVDCWCTGDRVCRFKLSLANT